MSSAPGAVISLRVVSSSMPVHSNVNGEEKKGDQSEEDSFTRNPASSKPPVARTVSSRSSQMVPGHGGHQAGISGQNALKSRKLGHRRVTQCGEVTYKKIETSQLIGSIQLGIHYFVGCQPGIPDRDILMEDFLFIETVSFTRNGLLQKTPAHRFPEFRFRTIAPFAFRYFRHLFEIETEDFLSSLCCEHMVELANPGVSGSIFYVTRDDRFICKTVQRKEADFLQTLLPGYYLNLQQNIRTLLPKFFGFYCYNCNAKNVRLVVMNNLIPSGLKMHHKFDLKGSTYKRKASQKERSKRVPTFKDLDFLEMYPEGILLQPEIYDNLMSSIQRDSRVLESYRIMDYSLLIGIHNLDQAAKEKDLELDGVSDVVPSDNISINTDKPSMERQGSIQYRDLMIAHSTALESINMEIIDSAYPRPSITGTNFPPDPRTQCIAGSDFSESGINNAWGGIPAKNHRGENLLLFVGIIDILQEYGVAKKVEHYWKSLIHDGETVSVQRPDFYAKRFKKFMGEKVFRPVTLQMRSAASIRRSQVKRTFSKESEPCFDPAFVSDPLATKGKKVDVGVTVIRIGSDNPVDAGTEMCCLPPVLQDRKRPSSTCQVIAVSEESAPKQADDHFVLASAVEASVKADDHDTGSIITMTSDEKVQIFVPSPLETTPYNTITRHSDIIRIGSLKQNARAHFSPVSQLQITTCSDKDDTTPFGGRKASVANSYRSLTPLNMDLSDSAGPVSNQTDEETNAAPPPGQADPAACESANAASDQTDEPVSLSHINLE